jgi:hypothetical protein
VSGSRSVALAEPAPSAPVVPEAAELAGSAESTQLIVEDAPPSTCEVLVAKSSFVCAVAQFPEERLTPNALPTITHL